MCVCSVEFYDLSITGFNRSLCKPEVAPEEDQQEVQRDLLVFPPSVGTEQSVPLKVLIR